MDIYIYRERERKKERARKGETYQCVDEFCTPNICHLKKILKKHLNYIIDD